MIDLKHWGFIEKFNGYQTACLILGFDPHDMSVHRNGAGIVRSRILDDHFNALSWLRTWGRKQPLENAPKDTIWSIETLKYLDWDEWFEEGSLNEYLCDRDLTSFDEQYFTRKEINNWLKRNNLESEYSFLKPDENRISQSPPLITRWPWGDHHTEALGHLEAAAKRFWTLHDPDDASTAPTNDEVAGWLQQERGVSKQKAEAIASILRADGLPTGPRR